jgi:hypothetical protein
MRCHLKAKARTMVWYGVPPVRRIFTYAAAQGEERVEQRAKSWKVWRRNVGQAHRQWTLVDLPLHPGLASGSAFGTEADAEHAHRNGT